MNTTAVVVTTAVKVKVNDKEVAGYTLKHSDIMNGGEVTFYLRSTSRGVE